MSDSVFALWISWLWPHFHFVYKRGFSIVAEVLMIISTI